MIRPLALNALLKVIEDPLQHSPWGCPAPVAGQPDLRELTLGYFKAQRFESQSFTAYHERDCYPEPDLDWHARRIAFLMHHGWGDALVLNLGLAGSGRRPRLEDGNHRLAAATLLGHERIMVTPMGSCSLIEKLFGPDAPDLEAAQMVEVSANQNTVWVHALDGSTVGRFDWRFGMDVHTTVSAQFNGASQCLHCTHTRPTADDWQVFCAVMWREHGIFVDRQLFACDLVEDPAESPRA